MTKLVRIAAAMFASTLMVPTLCEAQIRASEIGTISQVVDGTTITIQSSRPRARNRDPLFGTKAVHWDEVWTPGANWATTFEVSKNVKVNGHPVPRGKYSVWFVVKKEGDWTVVLDPKHRIFHMDPPDSLATQIRFPIRVEQGPFTEVLTWSVPEVRVSGTTIAFNWERKRLSLNVDVEPSLVVGLPRSEAEPYLGRYDYSEKSGDTVKHSVFTLTHEDGVMKGEWLPADPYMKKFAMIRIAPDWFAPGLYDKTGAIYEVMRPDMTFSFSRAAGRVVGLEVRYDDDSLAATATRKP